MKLETLRVIHVSRANQKGDSAGTDALQFSAGNQPYLFLETCERLLWVLDAGSGFSLREHAKDAQVFEGDQAYRFLLRLSSGLESELKGETNIFGQIKKAWSPYLGKLSWLQKLFEDAKEVRAKYLSELGSTSYGSLVRKMIHENGISENSPILLVGAGDMARSVAPSLLRNELWLVNRSAANLVRFHSDLLLRSPDARIRMIASDSEEREAWSQAQCAIVCVPADETRDPARIQAWRSSRASGRFLLHLGIRGEYAYPWQELPGFHCLDELWKAQELQTERRNQLLAAAYEACDRLTNERMCSVLLWNEAPTVQ